MPRSFSCSIQYNLNENSRLIGGAIMAQNLTYIQCGDYFIPDIRLAHTEAQILGKYGRMRRIFLERNAVSASVGSTADLCKANGVADGGVVGE